MSVVVLAAIVRRGQKTNRLLLHGRKKSHILTHVCAQNNKRILAVKYLREISKIKPRECLLIKFKRHSFFFFIDKIH